MIKFNVKIILVGPEEVRLNYIINAESPEEAIPLTINKQRFEHPRNVDIGDCIQVTNPATGLTLYYILDKPFESTPNPKPHFVPKKVSEAEFVFWIDYIGVNPSLKELGVDAAVHNTLDLLDNIDHKGVSNGSG